MIDSSEVFPEPEGPRSATNSPGSSTSDTPSSATMGPRKTRLTSLTTTRAPPVGGAERAVVSATDLDRPVSMLGPHPSHRDDDAEGQGEADGPLGPDDPVGELTGERPRGVGRVGVRAPRARVLRRDLLAVVEELVVGAGVQRLARGRPCGDREPPDLAGATAGVLAGEVLAGLRAVVGRPQRYFESGGGGIGGGNEDAAREQRDEESGAHPAEGYETGGRGPLEGAAARQDGRHGLDQDAQVEEDRPALQVEEVEAHEVVEVEVRAPGDLPEAGEAGQHQV